jgi:hypothetical protein
MKETCLRSRRRGVVLAAKGTRARGGAEDDGGHLVRWLRHRLCRRAGSARRGARCCSCIGV